eukprot:13038251-Alexandrium_andersonii.AAC.1
MAISEKCQVQATKRTVWPVGRAATYDPSGWMLGPELSWTRGLGDGMALPTCGSPLHASLPAHIVVCCVVHARA